MENFREPQEGVKPHIQQSKLDEKTITQLYRRRINHNVVGHPDVLNYFHCCSIINEIATGGFGTVFKAHNSIQGDFALKCIPPKAGDPTRTNNEANILRSISHPNILRYFDHFYLNTILYQQYLIMSTELLEETLLNVIDNPIGLSVYRNLVAQIGGALLYLHNSCIVHHDVKTENIMTDRRIDWQNSTRNQLRSQLKRCTFKLIDLGLARHYPNGPSLEEHYRSGTKKFGAPEKHITRVAYNPSLADVYSFGVVLFKSWVGNTVVDSKTKQLKSPINWYNLAHALLKGKILVERHIIATLAPEPSRLTLAKLIESTANPNGSN